MFSFRSKEKATTMTLDIPNRVVVRVMLVVVVTLIGLAAVQKASNALVLIFVAFFLSIALNSPVYWIAQRLPGKRKGSRTAATAISFLVVVLLLVGFLASIVPPLIKQTSSFVQTIPSLSAQVRDEDSGIGKFVVRYELQDDISKVSKQLSERLSDFSGTAVSGVQKVSTSLFAVLAVLVLTFMMLIEGPRWKALALDVIPDNQHTRVNRLAKGMYQVIKGYVNGQVVLALIASLMILPALLILHIPYPAALLMVVFIAGLIPMVGHLIGATIVTIVALFSSPWSALIILGYYILYQQIENYVIQPRVQANTTNLSPLIVFASVLVGVSFGGLLGGLVAIPVVGCLRVLLVDYLTRKNILESPKLAESTETPAKTT